MCAPEITKTKNQEWKVGVLPAFIYWGVEMGSDHSFFSRTHSGWRVKQKTVKEHVLEDSFSLLQELELSRAQGILSIEEKCCDTEINRAHSFCAQESSLLLDFVSRYVFPKEVFEKVLIDGNKVVHKNQNIYHQVLASDQSSVELIGKTLQATIQIKEIDCPASFTPYLYVRDEPGAWIVHIRLLPKVYKEIVTKINARWYNRALPAWISRVLFSLCFGSHWLLYRGEKKRQWSFMRKAVYKLLPLSAYPLAEVKKGEKLSLISTCRFAVLKKS
jgi:hypothetical protein